MLTDRADQRAFTACTAERWSIRKIARQLQMDWRTIKKYLQSAGANGRASRSAPANWILSKPPSTNCWNRIPHASAAVIAQRLQPLGYTGGRTILQRVRSRPVRPQPTAPRAFVRMEPHPGDRFEVDWGHFDVLDYAGDKRKLYAFALVECHSRMMYVEFTHSQSFETFVRCHIHAFQALGGAAVRSGIDNLATAVAEHDGRLVRFNPRFFAFAREYGFFPRACNRAAGWEKGKVERAGIGYIRQNFWPLRQFSDLHDVNRQAQQWLKEVANQRLHRETRQRPVDRFQPPRSRPLPALTPDYRDSVEALVHKDIRVSFDGNRYCAPPSLVGQKLIVKAELTVVSLYQRHKEIVSYPRCWQRGANHWCRALSRKSCWLRRPRRLARRHSSGCWPCSSKVHCSLRRLSLSARTGRHRPFALAADHRTARTDPQYGSQAVAPALVTADKPVVPSAPTTSPTFCASSYLRVPFNRPFGLRDPQLNELVTDPLSLLEYDAFILSSRKEPPMNLQEKLGQLKLPTMSQQLDRRLSEAATKELSVGQALEWLTDLELESRMAVPSNGAYGCHAAGTTYDRFVPLHTPQSAEQVKPRMLRLLDLEFLQKGTNLVFDWQSWRGQNHYWPKPSVGAPARRTFASSSPPPWTCSTICWPRRSITHWFANFAPTLILRYL